jgi:hypothetical protein
MSRRRIKNEINEAGLQLTPEKDFAMELQKSLTYIEKLTLMVMFSLGICGAIIRDAHSGAIQQVPIRWCGVQGSPSIVDPSRVGETNPNDVLWRRHERVTEEIYLRQGASMTFRSGILAFEVPGDGISDDDGRCEPGEACRPVQFEILGDNMGDEDGICERRPQVRRDEPCQDPGTFPLIPDPTISPGSRPGDIVSPEFEVFGEEVKRVMSNCRSVWEAAAPRGESIIAVHANQFVSLVETRGDDIGNDDGFCEPGEACVGGIPTRTAGVAFKTDPSNGADQLALQSLVVEDNAYSLARDPADKTLGHEIGHTLSLHHGDGVDDNRNYKAPTRKYTDPTACMDPNITNDDLDECPTLARLPQLGVDFHKNSTCCVSNRLIFWA